ncbi:hypothetical protein ACFL96_19090 [Thermoproteota archaeon]
MDKAKESRIKDIIDDLLDTLSYEDLEKELKKIAEYHCVTLKRLD